MAAQSNINIDMTPHNKHSNLLAKARLEMGSAYRRKSMETGEVEFRPSIVNDYTNLDPGSYSHHK